MMNSIFDNNHVTVGNGGAIYLSCSMQNNKGKTFL